MLVASDWHLGTRSPEGHGRLALAFLARARAAGERVILNGDIFESLFLAPGEAERAFPEVAALIDRMAAEGTLERIEGNHDPGSGPPSLGVEVEGLGRVLVAHGHGLDPVHHSAIGRLGHAISLRFGRLRVVRGSMHLADGVAQLLSGPRIVRTFRQRCLAQVEREGFALGVFGHIHQGEVAPGGRYANSGWLSGEALEYLVLERGGVRQERLLLSDL